MLIILVALLSCLNPLFAVNEDIKLITLQDSLEFYKARNNMLQMEIMLMGVQRHKEHQDKNILINEHNEILSQYKIATYTACSFSALMIVLVLAIFFKNRKNRVLSRNP